ncbi:hypothetical protein K502DRAFT_339611 [Neoconidiobolus thromboides FSU 785]|nr:hypothetical protein K502DRAFT_339611 [Neoconidiobolus thromboides FSU 785]
MESKRNSILPNLIKQTEIIELESNHTIKKHIFLHCIGPDSEPLIDWSTYNATSYSTYRPNIDLDYEYRYDKPNSDSEEEYSDDDMNKEINCTLLNQTKIMQTKNSLLEKIGVEFDRGITNAATFTALKDLPRTRSLSSSNFSNEDIKANKVLGSFNILLAKIQLKLSDLTNNPDKVYAKAERNLMVGRLQIGKPLFV